MVVFPYMIIPLFVGRDKSLAAVEKAIETNRSLIVVSQKDITKDDPDVDDLFNVGTVVSIMQMVKLPDGIVKILVEGGHRARVDEVTIDPDGGFFSAAVTEIPDSEMKDVKIEALMRNVISQFEQYIKINKKIPVEIVVVANNVESPGRLADIITAHLDLSVDSKQEILEAFAPEDRLERLSAILHQEIEMQQLDKKIRDMVRQQMETMQKEYYLREQARAIHKELGDKDDLSEEVEMYKKKIAVSGMTEETETKVLKELDKLAKTSPLSAESGVLRNYLDMMVELPWNVSSDSEIDIKKAAEILDEDHFGLDKTKDRIIEFLAVQKLKKSMKGPILCLMGPPGVGKTSVARSIARATGREFVRISLGGVHDEAEIRGHRKTYVGAMPGRIIQMIKQAGTNNPVFLLDEIDKMGNDYKGDPSSALLEVLDPEQNSTYTDHFLGVPFDLSNVMFLTTANIPHPIPGPLRDRMEMISIPGYTEEEKLEIAHRYLVPKQQEENGLKKEKISFGKKAIVEVIRKYTREAGVRSLERQIGGIWRKIARIIVTSKKKVKSVTAASVRKYLGIPRYDIQKREEDAEIGVVTGLAWTQVGGCTLPIEAISIDGKGKLIITGQLGEVMQESVRAAVSFLRSHYDDFNMDKNFHKKKDIHVHAPEGAIPKDGPSAGITIATAVVSALTGVPVLPTVAMTGEITVLGKVLPVGGIKEKVLAAYRMGIYIIVLSERNKKDVAEIPEGIRSHMTFHYVKEFKEVLQYVLVQS
jgi:ATP-dependent Lon protease